MRIATPPPARLLPDSVAIDHALASATHAALRNSHGQTCGRVSGAALREILGLLRFRTDVAPFDHWYLAPALLEIYRVDEKIATVEIAADGSICFSPWGGFVEIQQPGELFEALSRHGLPELLEAHDASSGPEAEEARRTFRAAVPPALSSVYDPAWESLLPADFRGAALTERLVLSLGEQGAIEAIWAWYGSGRGPLRLRPEYEKIPRTLLAAFSFDTLVLALAETKSEAALAGAARTLLDASPMPPILARPVLALGEVVRRSLVAAARATAGEEDAARLSLELFPESRIEPAAVQVLGRSDTLRLDVPVTDGHSVYARDGKTIARFCAGERTALLRVLGPTVPLAFHGGSLWIRLGDTVKKLSPEGELIEEAYGATEAERSAATAALERCSPCRLTGLPLPSTPDEAYVEYAHLGLPLPPWTRVTRSIHLDPGGRALVDERELALPGRPLFWDVAEAGTVVIVTEAAPGASALVWLTEAGISRVETPFDPGAVKALVAAEQRSFLIVDEGRGFLVAAVPRR